MSPLLLLLLLSLLASSLALDIGLSYYPGNNLWRGESLILECRLSGLTRYKGGGESGPSHLTYPQSGNYGSVVQALPAGWTGAGRDHRS